MPAQKASGSFTLASYAALYCSYVSILVLILLNLQFPIKLDHILTIATSGSIFGLQRGYEHYFLARHYQYSPKNDFGGACQAQPGKKSDACGRAGYICIPGEYGMGSAKN